MRHTASLFGGTISVLFYDVTTLYFEADREDELRRPGFSKEGRHSNPQIILGLLVSHGGYPLAYSIHEGNKYEGHTMLPVGYTEDRAQKDAYNRDKGVRRLEKAYRKGTLTKENINRRGYNKFLTMDGDVRVAIDYAGIEEDVRWDGLKGYLTNTDILAGDVYEAYHSLWHVERAFRIAKSKIEIRPMFHFTRRRIEAHVCICFVALKVYKELERMLKKSDISMSVDKVLALAKTVTTILIRLPKNKEIISKTMLIARHQRIAKLFDENFLGDTMTVSGL